MGQDDLYSAIKAAKRKKFLFGYKDLYQPISPNPDEALDKLERDGGFRFPSDIRAALFALGGCSIDDLYIHPTDRIYRFDGNNGRMAGLVAFASDIFGNYFAFDPSSESPAKVYYYSHDPLGWAVVSANFSAYLQSFVNSGFRTLELTGDLNLNEV